MSALTATYALASLLDAPPVWLPPISHCEIATTDGVWGAHAELDVTTEAEAYKWARAITEAHGVELHDDGRTILVDVDLTGVAFRFWWLRPVLRWHVPEQCATCPTKLGAPDVRFVRLGEGGREAPVICVPCRDRMHAAWVEQGEKDTREGESTPQPAELTIYRASHDSIVMGLYTTREAAREHCETLMHREQPDADLNWYTDPTEGYEDAPEDLFMVIAGGESDTGYTVTALTVASEYDEEADE